MLWRSRAFYNCIKPDGSPEFYALKGVLKSSESSENLCLKTQFFFPSGLGSHEFSTPNQKNP